MKLPHAPGLLVINSMGLQHVPLYGEVIGSVYLKLELLTQFPAYKKYVFLRASAIYYAIYCCGLEYWKHIWQVKK